MSITLSSGFNPSIALKSSFSTHSDDAAVAAQMEQERLANMGLVGRGLTRGIYNMGSGLADAGAQLVEPFAPQYSQPVFDWASAQRNNAKQLYAPTDVRRYEDIHGVGDAANYIGNMAIENIPNAIPSIAGGVAARVGLRGVQALSPFAKTAIGGSIAAFPQQMGEGVGALREDPSIMANTTPMQRLGAAAGYGAVTAPLEALPDTLLANRLMGGGEKAVKNVFKDGIKATAKDAAKHMAVAPIESAITEGVPEALEQKAQQVMQSGFNPDRDTKNDARDLKESFFGGWAAGAGTSAAGRGADVAWAQGRGATEAIRGLLKDKILPPALKSSDDNTILDWNKEDDDKRNTWASDVADRIMNSDASQKMKEAAQSFYDKASQGVSDAWKAVTDPIKESDGFQTTMDSVDRFTNSVKSANKAAFGEKNNAEATPEDRKVYEAFKQHLDPNIYNAKFDGGTDAASKLFNSMKSMIAANDLDGVHLNELAHHFGGKQNVQKVAEDMRREMVRQGMVDDDETFSKLFSAAHESSHKKHDALVDVVDRYSPYASEMSDGEKAKYAKLIYDTIRNDDSGRGPKKGEKGYDKVVAQREAFTRDTKTFFGKNYDKAIQAFMPQNTEEHIADTSEGSGLTEHDAPHPVFIGSADKSVRKSVADGTQENSIEGHGGFWKLGSGKDVKAGKEITKRFNDLQADLRRDGHYVKALTPLEYAAASGISAGKIAGHLGTSVEGLKDHPARMLQVEKRDMGKDKLTLDHDDLLNLNDKTAKALDGMGRSVQIKDPAQVAAIKAALGLNKKGQGGAQRKAMLKMGLEHGVKLRETNAGTFLENNLHHGGNGVFTVHMDDGTKHNISAQTLIDTMRTRGNGEVSSRSAYRMFTAGIAAIHSIEGVKNITVSDIWGREDEKPFHGVEGGNSQFKLTGDLTLGNAHKASSRGGLLTDVDRAQAVVQKLKAQRDELRATLKATPQSDKKTRAALSGDIKSLGTKIEEAEADYTEIKEAAEAFTKEIEGEGDRPGFVDGSNAKEGVHDFNDDGTPVQPYGKDIERTSNKTPTVFNGQTLHLRAGVGAKNLTGGARQLIAGLKALRGLVTSPKLDMALDLIGRAAAADKDSNVKARDALLGMAANAMTDAVADEMLATHEAGLKAEGAERQALRQKYADLRKVAGQSDIVLLNAKYLANKEKADKVIGEYKAYVPLKAKVEKVEDEQPADDFFELAKRDKAEFKKMTADELRVAIEDQKANGGVASDVVDARLGALERELASREDAAVPEQENLADTHEKAFEQALSDAEKLGKNLKGVSDALRKAFGNLKDAWKSGTLDNKELVANLRAAMASFRAAAGDLGRIVASEVQKVIKAYQQAKAAEPAEQFNAEGSFTNGKGVTPEQLAEVKDYIEKTLGPKVKVELAKTLGGNSAAWNRVNGEAIIRIAANASNPTSKAHHEAMHEFFQRLTENNPEAAEVLKRAAASPAITRQIEQFFHNDPNYSKIKAALAADEHERVAYMFQLWAAGKLNVGPATKNVFQKVVSFMKKALGLLSNDQKAEAIMDHFHRGEMSTQSDVARVLASDPVQVQRFVNRASEYAQPLSEKAKEMFYTSQNILIESGNKGFEKIGRMFSTETGRTNEDISFFDAKTMKTNQMNDRLWSIMNEKGADGKSRYDSNDISAALDALQQGVVSKDTNIAHLQARIRKMLDDIHNYMSAVPDMKIKKLKNYFPRAWDSLVIAENKAEFIKMLEDDHLKTTGEVMPSAVAAGIADNIIQNRGAEPLNEDELVAGYTPFMAASNKRVLDFITNPEFSKFQEKSIESVLTNYIAQAVHKTEYTRRFGPNGSKLGEMILDAVGEEVGKEWAPAVKAASKTLADMKAALAKANKTPEEIAKELFDNGYLNGRIQHHHVAAELAAGAGKDAYRAFEPKLRQQVRAIMAMEGTLGADINPKLRKLQSALIVYTNLRTLSMSLFSQVIDPLGVMIRGGTAGDAFNTFKLGLAGTWAGWKGTPLEDSATKLAMQLGIVDAGGYLNSQGNAYASVFMGKTAQKWNDRLFRMNGVEGFSQGTRTGAMLAAISFIKAHSTLPTEHSERWLAELDLKPSDVVLKGGELDYTNQKIQQAIFRWVEGAILRPNASMRPSWASDPHFALIFHMKQFTYAMQKVLLERVFKEAEHGNLDPGITMLLTYVPAMIAADVVRGLLANGGNEPPWKKKWNAGDYLWNGVQRAGLLGVPQFGLDAAQWGPAELLGPMAGQIAHAGHTYSRDIEKDIDLDIKASTTGAIRDIERAASYNGIEQATKKTLRDALPINSLAKHYLYDDLVN